MGSITYTEKAGRDAVAVQGLGRCLPASEEPLIFLRSG